MTHLKEGDKAPVFKLNDQDGEPVSLKDFKGKKIALYFYPKDDTSGCTTQSCNLRDNHTKLKRKGYVILGISPDNERSHQKFIKKFDLPFTLLVDTDHKIAEKYGVWGEKMNFGHKYMGVIRTTFIINDKGVIEKVIDKVVTGDHATQIIEK
jgi:peroxiredoxin Q/BCP